MNGSQAGSHKKSSNQTQTMVSTKYGGTAGSSKQMQNVQGQEGSGHAAREVAQSLKGPVGGLSSATVPSGSSGFVF